MGLSCFRAISGLGMGMGMDGMGWDLCAGLFYEHRFAMLINIIWTRKKDLGADLLPEELDLGLPSPIWRAGETTT